MSVTPSDPAVGVEVDLAEERLWRNGRPIGLRPKTLAVLRALLADPGRLVTKPVLVEAAWGRSAVSDGVLTVCIRELRQALGEDRGGQFIETVHRRGYRLVARLAPPTRGRSGAVLMPRRSGTAGAARAGPVGRQREIDWLHGRLARARGGTRQVVFVTGEAGIGKTTLLDAFASGLDPDDDTRLTVGRCIEHHGPAEAYLPVLEALGRLGKEHGKEVAEILARHAPTWLDQLPALRADLAAFPAPTAATSARMLRELAEALEVLTADTPLVLIIDDLHWSDHSTLDLIAALARRREPARLLLVGAYRPAEVFRSAHPLQGVRSLLLAHGLAEELAVTLLPESAVADYLTSNLPGLARVREVARLVHRRTDGNPLFLVNVLGAWRTRGWLTESSGHWMLNVGVEELATGTPETLREMLGYELERLAHDERRVLEAAGVAGVDFSAADVAAALADEDLDVEEVCARLARRQQFLDHGGEVTWPDGTTTTAYRFRHALYQEIVYERVAPARRVVRHRRIGERQERGHAGRVDECAATLALHFERGGDDGRAITYRRRAAATALRRHAYADAVEHLGRARTLLGRAPGRASRLGAELEIQLMLGPALMATHGYGAPEVEATYRRAREICRAVSDTARLGTVLLGLRLVYTLQARLGEASKLGEECLALARKQPALAIEAHLGLAVTSCFQARFGQGAAHASRGLALCERQRTRARARVDDPGVGCLTYWGLALWFLGDEARAVERIRAALTRADALGEPFSRAYALIGAAWFHQFRGDADATLAAAEAAVTLSQVHGFPLRQAQGTIMVGWALVKRGRGTAGVEQIRRGLASFQATGATLNLTYYLALLAEAQGDEGQREEALAVLASAFARLEGGGERWWAAELYHLRGKLRAGSSDARIRAAAVADVRRALLVARRQHAEPLARRAAASLAALRESRATGSR